MLETKILVVDDEEKIRELLRMYLEGEGWIVVEASNGQEALDKLKKDSFEIMILDLMMPGMDGWAVCRELRKTSNMPIIILTARGDEIDRVLGLELGADDYVVKPFSPRELVARVKAVLRRTMKAESESEEDENDTALSFPGLVIDPAAREVKLTGKLISLTPKEFDLLYFLAQSPGRVFSREQLLEHIWGYDFYGEARTVDTHITRLRDKLARVPAAPQYISTVWGVGYKFEVDK